MNHYRHAVSRKSHVQFDPGRSVAQRARERRERVFRRQCRGAAMADDERGFVGGNQRRRVNWFAEISLAADTSRA